ncbi:MAG: DUF3501 family protein [Alphaproteobacteria bacterium]
MSRAGTRAITPAAITAADILPPDDYERRRAELRGANMARKKARRVHVGPFVTFYFENRDTMWLQIHEMLRIEGGGEAQIAGELAAYNPLIPNGSELIATMMIEIDDAQHRAAVLARLGGIESTVTLAFAGHAIQAAPVDPDEERTTPEGKASSIHFLRFSFAPAAIAAFQAPGIQAPGTQAPVTQVVLALGHPNYQHAAVVPEAVRQALAEDFDRVGG